MKVPFWRTFYHLVWATQGRHPTIDEERASTIRTSIVLVAHEQRALIHAIGWMPDHVHVAISIPPSAAVSKVLQLMKGRSSHMVNQSPRADLGEFRWQPEYGVVTFGERSLPNVVTYVENQPEHHRTQTLRPYLERITHPDFDSPDDAPVGRNAKDRVVDPTP